MAKVIHEHFARQSQVLSVNSVEGDAVGHIENDPLRYPRETTGDHEHNSVVPRIVLVYVTGMRHTTSYIIQIKSRQGLKIQISITPFCIPFAYTKL